MGRWKSWVGGLVELAIVLLGLGALGEELKFVDAPGSPIPIKYAWRAVVGDFNDDGYPDIAVLSPLYYCPDLSCKGVEDTAAVGVLLGRGDGTFEGPTFFPVGKRSKNPVRIAVGDVNNDGHLDLVVSNPRGLGFVAFPSSIYVLLGDGKGAFTPAPGSPFTTEHNAGAMVIADFDKDGNPDLAVAHPNAIVLWYGDGTGRFPWSRKISLLFGTNPKGIVAADFDRDGYPDLAIASSGRENVLVLLNNFGEGFRLEVQEYKLPGPAEDLATGDFNGDGIVDLVAVSRSVEVADGVFKSHVSVLLGDGAGGFHGPIHIPIDGRNPRSIAVADLDRDGNLDLVTANDGSGDLSVLLGDGMGGFRLASCSPVRIRPCFQCLTWVGAADFNGDGWVDLAVINTLDDVVVIKLNGLGIAPERGR